MQSSTAPAVLAARPSSSAAPAPSRAPSSPTPEVSAPGPGRASATPTPTTEAPSASDERLFPPEGSAEGCASGECLPETAPDEPEEAGAPAQRSSADVWRRAVEAVRAVSVRFGKSLSFGRLVAVEPGTLKIAFPPGAGFHRTTVFGSARPEIEKLISTALGQATRLQEDTSARALAAAPKSIAEQELSDRTARENSIDARIRVHPAVQNVLRLFGGQIENIQVLDALPPVVEESSPPPEDDT